MHLSPFHAAHKARELSNYAFGRKKLIPVFAASDIEIFPYQIAAAQFALRSPYLKGAILCDEGSLGKTYEAMLVIAQLWYESKERILLLIPTPLLHQWAKIIENQFSIPFHVMDSNTTFGEQLASGIENPFQQEGIILTTYDFAAEKAEYLTRIPWDLAVFEEAHHLRRVYTGEHKGAASIREAVGNAFKLLLTATPMQNSILDLYGLVSFIDDSVFPDEKTFYQRYFRKPENYAELAERVSKFCFRTTRPEVANYVKIPERIPLTVEFTLTKPEQRLYDLLDAYLQKGSTLAFPKMDRYDLALLLFHTFSSSTFAIERTLRGVVRRVEAMHQADSDNSKIASELAELRQMHGLAAEITENAKARALLDALKQGFAQLRKAGAKHKALIFTENRATQDFLHRFLDKNGYTGKVLAYNGSRSREYSIMERFEKEAHILIATDLAAEGFNLEFCSFVINYDLPYNTLTIEQRISRCHRQGQQSDVLVVNFLNPDNFADVRILELINKRVLQFSGIFGMSDAVIGNLGVDLRSGFSKVLGKARTKEEIDRAYQGVLQEFEAENKRLVKQAEHSLFTSFTREVASRVEITPQYIEDKSKEINDDLWLLTRYFFEDKCGFRLDDETRTVSCSAVIPPKVFTGTRMGRNEYSMAKGYQPRSGRHTITGTLAKSIVHEIAWTGIPERGEITISAACEPCTIGFYQVRVKPQKVYWGGYRFYVFVGKTVTGLVLSHEECLKLMALPVVKFKTHGAPCGEKNRHLRSPQNHELDALIVPETFIQQVFSETGTAEKEEIELFKEQAADQKMKLERGLENLRFQVKTMQGDMEKDIPRLEKLTLQKQLNGMIKELKQGEQNLFMDCIRLDMELEKNIQEFVATTQLVADVQRQFVVQVTGR